MSNKFFNFYYDPVRQGFDSDTWTTVFGVPVVVGNQLSLDGGSEIVHFADLLRGDVTFNVSLPAPQAGDGSRMGLIQYGKSEFACFEVQDDIFYASVTGFTDDSVASYRVEIPWSSEWTNANTNYRIKWEAGALKFYVNNCLLATVDTKYTNDVLQSAVPGDPMNLWLIGDSSSPMLVNFIEVQGVESSNLIV